LQKEHFPDEDDKALSTTEVSMSPLCDVVSSFCWSVVGGMFLVVKVRSVQ